MKSSWPSPFGLRYQLAFDATLTAAVLDVFIRSVFAGLRRAAVREGIADAQCGAITALQRFGYRRSYCDLLHEQRLGRPPFVRFQGRLNLAVRRSSLAAVSSAISSHHTRRCAWKSWRSPFTSPRAIHARTRVRFTPNRVAAPATE